MDDPKQITTTKKSTAFSNRKRSKEKKKRKEKERRERNQNDPFDKKVTCRRKLRILFSRPMKNRYRQKILSILFTVRTKHFLCAILPSDR